MSEIIKNMFSRVSGSYDFMNNLLSLGIHHQWRRKAVQLAQPGIGSSILDCAAGTGDFAIEFKRQTGKESRIIAVDFCEEMVELGRKKSKEKKLDIQFETADILKLRFGDNSFDIASIAFGIRNVDSIEKCLLEIARVVKPGGKIVVLEFGMPYMPMYYLFLFYSRVIIPILGNIFAGDKSAYDYLQSSALKFPCREQFTSIMEQTRCFSESRYFPLSSGIAYVYIGVVSK
ncbi:MAG: ubiquinone/menaquinone biosynthesis methyltransferase [Ignavibacteria bacterium]|nr:ubiquinone/menaquinone biosynthesis methyltransferase [Ignavibacteria bacterium]